MKEERKQTLAEKLEALKNGPASSPTRVSKNPPTNQPPTISRAVSEPYRKLLKKALSIAELITPADVEDSMRVIREAKLATTSHWDGLAKEMVTAPDHKTRLAAVTLERAYHEGLPVARAISVNASFESADDTLARLKASPEAMKAIAGLREAGLKLAIGDEVINVESEVKTEPE